MNIFIFVVVLCEMAVMVRGGVVVFVPDKMNMTTAAMTCQSQGLALPQFPTQPHFDRFVQQLTVLRIQYGYLAEQLWLGMEYAGSGDGSSPQHFRWLDGSAVLWPSLPWAKGDLGDVYGQSCVRIGRNDSLLRTTNCNAEKALICCNDGQAIPTVTHTGPKWYHKAERKPAENQAWTFTDSVAVEENHYVGPTSGSDVTVNDVTDCFVHCVEDSDCWYIRVSEVTDSAATLCRFFGKL